MSSGHRSPPGHDVVVVPDADPASFHAGAVRVEHELHRSLRADRALGGGVPAHEDLVVPEAKLSAPVVPALPRAEAVGSVLTWISSPSWFSSTSCVAIFSTPSRNVCHDAHHVPESFTRCVGMPGRQHPRNDGTHGPRLNAGRAHLPALVRRTPLVGGAPSSACRTAKAGCRWWPGTVHAWQGYATRDPETLLWVFGVGAVVRCGPVSLGETL